MCASELYYPPRPSSDSLRRGKTSFERRVVTALYLKFGCSTLLHNENVFIFTAVLLSVSRGY